MIRRALLFPAIVAAFIALLVAHPRAQFNGCPAGFCQPIAGASGTSIVLTSAAGSYLAKIWGAGATPTDGTKATISLFLKYSILPSDDAAGFIFSHTGTDFVWVRVLASGGDNLEQLYSPDAFTTTYPFRSTDTITDTTTWHSVVIAFDSTQVTASNRVHIYIDGIEVGYSSQTAPPQNTVWSLAVNNTIAQIGNQGTSLNAKLAYYYFIDGQALTPSSFTSGTGSGTTHPIAYSGAYGANGFFLNFTGNNADDQSGNHNDWSPVNSPTFSSDVPT